MKRSSMLALLLAAVVGAGALAGCAEEEEEAAQIDSSYQGVYSYVDSAEKEGTITLGPNSITGAISVSNVSTSGGKSGTSTVDGVSFTYKWAYVYEGSTKIGVVYYGDNGSGAYWQRGIALGDKDLSHVTQIIASFSLISGITPLPDLSDVAATHVGWGYKSFSD